jgi:hypothetical protein
LASFGFSSSSSLGSSQVHTPDCKVLHSKAKSELASLEPEAKLELNSRALISPILGKQVILVHSSYLCSYLHTSVNTIHTLYETSSQSRKIS